MKRMMNNIDNFKQLRKEDIEVLSATFNTLYSEYKYVNQIFKNTLKEKMAKNEYENLDTELYKAIYSLVAKAEKVLYQNCIFKYSTDDIHQIFNNCFSIEEELYSYLSAKNNVENFNKQINDRRSYQQSSRGYWQGGGFGIKGAIKGAVQASILNAGESVFYGAKDSVTNYFDNKKKEKNRLDEYNSIDINEFITALYDAFEVMKSIIVDLLVKEKKISGFKYRKNESECRKNHIGLIKAYDEKIISKEVYQKKLIELINEYPYIIDVYFSCFLEFGDKTKELFKLAEKFGLLEEYLDRIHKFTDEVVNTLLEQTIMNTSDTNMKNILETIVRVNELLPDSIYGELIEDIKTQIENVEDIRNEMNEFLNQYLGVCMFKNIDFIWDSLNDEIDPVYESILLNTYTYKLEKLNKSILYAQINLNVGIAYRYLCNDKDIKNSATAKSLTCLLSSDVKRYNLCPVKEESVLNNILDLKSPMAYYAKAKWYENNGNNKLYLENIEKAAELDNIEANYELYNLIITNVKNSKKDLSLLEYLRNNNDCIDYLDYCEYYNEYLLYGFYKEIINLEGQFIKSKLTTEMWDYLNSLKDLYYDYHYRSNYMNNIIKLDEFEVKAMIKHLDLDPKNSIHSLQNNKVDYILEIERRLKGLKFKWKELNNQDFKNAYNSCNNEFYNQFEKKIKVFKYSCFTEASKIEKMSTVKYVSSIKEYNLEIAKKFNIVLDEEYLELFDKRIIQLKEQEANELNELKNNKNEIVLNELKTNNNQIKPKNTKETVNTSTYELNLLMLSNEEKKINKLVDIGTIISTLIIGVWYLFQGFDLLVSLLSGALVVVILKSIFVMPFIIIYKKRHKCNKAIKKYEKFMQLKKSTNEESAIQIMENKKK